MRKIQFKLTKNMPRWDGFETVPVNKNQRGDESFPYLMGSSMIPSHWILLFTQHAENIQTGKLYPFCSMLGPEPLHSKDEATVFPFFGEC